jgi:hypothetical protein
MDKNKPKTKNTQNTMNMNIGALTKLFLGSLSPLMNVVKNKNRLRMIANPRTRYPERSVFVFTIPSPEELMFICSFSFISNHASLYPK